MDLFTAYLERELGVGSRNIVILRAFYLESAYSDGHN